MNFREYADRDMMMIALAGKISSQLGEALRAQGRASLCLPGGTTPGPVFDMLSAVDLDWENVAVFLNDERWVGEESPRSNTRLLRERLLVGKAASAKLVPLYLPGAAPEAAMAPLSDGIAPHLPITVLLLGMGTDMHTASLFPGADRLQEAMAEDAPILMPMRAEGAAEPRITLTRRVLLDALHCHILISGAEKRAAIENAEGLDEMQAPVRAFLDDAMVHWAE
ncbi:MAG: 6-phosphogluconolactonase [Pseudorhodobacter sp.]